MDNRNKTFSMQLTEEEERHLVDLAQRSGRTKTGVMRALLNNATVGRVPDVIMEDEARTSRR